MRGCDFTSSQLHLDLMILPIVTEGNEFVGLHDAIDGDAFHSAAGFGLQDSDVVEISR